MQLKGEFGGFETAVGRVRDDVIIFDGIKYGEHQRFMRSTAAPAPTGHCLEQDVLSLNLTPRFPTVSYALLPAGRPLVTEYCK